MEKLKNDPIVLTVEDDPDSSRLLSYLLKILGFKRVLAAKDGQEAITLLDTKGLTCIISDWNMPRMNGIDLFEHLKTLPEASKVSFILLTTESQHEKVIEAIEAGITNYIVKPYTADVMEKKLRQLLGTNFPTR